MRAQAPALCRVLVALLGASLLCAWGYPPAPANGTSLAPSSVIALPFALDALRFRSAHDKLVAVAGALSAVVPQVYRATSVEAFALLPGQHQVRVRYSDQYACAGPDERFEVVLELAPLAARMLNADALTAHRARRFDDAARGFAAALELDPGLELARTNLACALNQLGKREAAVSALLPLLRSNPVLAYGKVRSDPELRSLLTAPEVAALATRPAARVDIGQIQAPLVGLGGRAVAIAIHELSCCTYEAKLSLVVFDRSDGHELYRATLIDMRESDPESGGVRPRRRAEVQRRLDDAAAWLADLGFAADPHARTFDLAQLTAGAAIAGSALRVQLTENGEQLRVLAGASELAHVGVTTRYDTRAVYLPSAHALAVGWSVESPDGCDIGDTVFAALLPLRPAR